MVAFTAEQIPGIDDRTYPAALAGPRYPEGIPIHAEEDLPRLIADLEADECAFSYSDVSYDQVMGVARVVQAAGASFTLLGPRDTQLASTKPVISVCAVRTGCGKSQTPRRVIEILMEPRAQAGGDPPPHALRRPGGAEGAALRRPRRPGAAPLHHRGDGGVRAAHRARAT